VCIYCSCEIQLTGTAIHYRTLPSSSAVAPIAGVKPAGDSQPTAVQKQLSEIAKGAPVLFKLTNGTSVQGGFFGYDHWGGTSGTAGIMVSSFGKNLEQWYPLQQIETVVQQ
jgi:hypothetical protein